MTYRKKTLRGMPAATREVAKIINEVGSIERRLANRLPRLEELERVARQWDKGLCARQDHSKLQEHLHTVYAQINDLVTAVTTPTDASSDNDVLGIVTRHLISIREGAPAGLLDELFEDGDPAARN